MKKISKLNCAILAAMVSAVLVFVAFATGDDLVVPPPKPVEAPEKVIQVHHHYYFGYGAYGPQSTSTVSQASVFTPGYHPWYEGQVRPWDINWGKLGFYGYFGKQGDNMGLIVSKVDPGSPAEQFGLVPGDMIISIDGQNISDSSYRVLEAIFASITIKPEAKISMTVWNVQTRRTNTLKAELVEDNR